jgi:hypothetical protein
MTDANQSQEIENKVTDGLEEQQNTPTESQQAAENKEGEKVDESRQDQVPAEEQRFTKEDLDAQAAKIRNIERRKADRKIEEERARSNFAPTNQWGQNQYAGQQGQGQSADVFWDVKLKTYLPKNISPEDLSKMHADHDAVLLTQQPAINELVKQIKEVEKEIPDLKRRLSSYSIPDSVFKYASRKDNGLKVLAKLERDDPLAFEELLLSDSETQFEKILELSIADKNRPSPNFKTNASRQTQALPDGVGVTTKAPHELSYDERKALFKQQRAQQRR